MKHTITQYDTTGQGRFDPSWYADVWTSDTVLKMQVKGMPFDAVFHIDRRAIPQLIGILQRIQNDKVCN
jgi:hypothetical protein